LFNEEEGIKFLIDELCAFNEANIDLNIEFIFVNDGSKDLTLNILKTERNRLNSKVISFSKNFGSHAALRAGILNASFDFITFMYADLQDPLSLIREMYEESLKGNDIVWANRRTTKSRFFEGKFSKIYAKLMRKYAIQSFPKNGFDIVFFNHKIASVLNNNILSNSSIFLQILSLGFRQSTIQYNKTERKFGKSKWTISKKIKLFIDSFVSFSYAPLKFVTIVGILMSTLGFVYSSYIILRKIIFDDLNSGWPTIISILLIGFGATNISLGIVAEYLWRTFDAARKSEVFIIDEIIENKKL
jgi:dolichol-phosphate mannosyltransferase